MARSQRLNQKGVTVLRLIAEGHSYVQIVDTHADITYLDIFTAAAEALEVLKSSSSYEDRMAKIKQNHSRAYERWTDEEDRELAGMCQEGNKVAEMADHLGRQPSAIRSRLVKLGLEARAR
jgi:transcriptional regulator with GAF, ATPase, and Fis domain